MLASALNWLPVIQILMFTLHNALNNVCGLITKLPTYIRKGRIESCASLRDIFGRRRIVEYRGKALRSVKHI